MDLENLLGLSEDEAARKLEAAGLPWVTRRYSSFRVPDGMDEWRVVRACFADAGLVDLTTCAFRGPREGGFVGEEKDG